MAGDTLTGVEVMRMDEGLDTGPVLARATTRIDALDTAGALAERLSRLGAALMVDTLAALARGSARPRPQPEAGATYARKIKTSEARIRWDQPAEEVDRRIRGLSPFPGAWFEAPGVRGPVRIKALLSQAEDGDGAPGEVLDDELLIACGAGAVRILRAQREGRAAADSEEFLRGFPLAPGARVS
jgi:methionyl-tRNA formyltransferase